MALLQSSRLSTTAQTPQSSAAFAVKNCKAGRRFQGSVLQLQAHQVTGALQSSKRQLLASVAFAPIAASRRQAVVMAAQASSRDLLIVGPGVLGSYLGTLWKQEFPDSAVTAQTNSESNHERLRKMGLTPVTRDAAPKGKKYPYVLFAAPPSGSEDYPGAVKAATEQWDGTGSFVFTSSMSICATEDGSAVSEDCPLVPEGKSPSTDKLLGAEKAALAANGNVLRLVGLYHASRGPHTFFIKMGEVPRYGGYVVNMLHYEDAARMALAILRGDGKPDDENFRGQIFVGTDGHPLTFQEMTDACFASGLFGNGSVKFTGTPESGGGKGKVVDNEHSKQLLGSWKPKYESFKQFFKDGGKDYYNTSGLF